MHSRKPIALLDSESIPQDSQNLLKSQKVNQNFIKNFENSRVEDKKHMSDSLKTNILFNGYH